MLSVETVEKVENNRIKNLFVWGEVAKVAKKAVQECEEYVEHGRNHGFDTFTAQNNLEDYRVVLRVANKWVEETKQNLGIITEPY